MTSKPFDYYAGYPNQQRMPKWLGVTLGSIFGGLTILSMALCIRMVLPARTAEASVVAKPAPTAPVATAPAAAPAPLDDDQADVQAASATTAPKLHKAAHVGHGKHAKHGVRGIALASSKPAPVNAKYKKAQLFAKSVSSSRRDKKARDDLDKLLGM